MASRRYSRLILVVVGVWLAGAEMSLVSALAPAKKCDTKAAKVNCARANLYGMNFASKKLVKSNFTNANLERAIFRGANLTGANFTGAKLQNAIFAGANLTGANFTGAQLQNAIFTDAILDKSTIAGVSTTGGLWSGVKSMRGAKLSGIEFDGAAGFDFSGAVLTNVAINGNLSRAIFRNATFAGYSIFEPNLPIRGATERLKQSLDSLGFMEGTDFTGAQITAEVRWSTAIKGSIGLPLSSIIAKALNLNLSGMDLTGVDFTAARPDANFDLVDVNLTNANLSRRTIMGGLGGSTILTGANFKGARIANVSDWKTFIGSPATFEGATFESVSFAAGTFDGTNFAGANLRYVDPYTNASFRNANMTGITLPANGFSTKSLQGADFTGSTWTSLQIFPRSNGTYICPSGLPSRNSSPAC